MDHPRADAPPDAAPTADRLATVDALADEFERAWTPGDEGLLGRSVDAASVDVRGGLARELVKLDAELRARHGLPIDPADHCRRAPEILDADGWPPDDVMAAWERAAGRRGDAPPAWPAPSAGEAVGAYRLVARRAVAARPTLFDAVESATGAAVLVSVYPPMRRSAAEATRSAVLAFVEVAGHHIPAVRSCGAIDGHLCVVQDPPASPTLADLTTAGGLPWRRAAQLASAAARAVAAVHAAGFWHGVLSPAAVAVAGDGRADLIGLPSPAGDPPARGDTAALDDPRLRYVAPEEAWSAGTAPDRRAADVFALGAVLYHLLTGRPPYADPDPRQALADAATAAWDDGPLARCRMPAAVRAVVRAALRRDPALRPRVAEALAAELDAAARRARVAMWVAGVVGAVVGALVLARMLR